jgi:hypothetical protein
LLALSAQVVPKAQLVHLVLAVLVHAAVCTVPEPHAEHIEHSFASDASEKVPFGHVRHCV